MKKRVADILADFLAERGIRDCFMVTGGGAMHLDDAIGHHPMIRCIFNHHEQACAIAAESYARLHNHMAAVCVTSGPGGTNAVTGVMGAWVDSIPMLVISGQVKRETTLQAAPGLPLRQLGDQEFNIVSAVKCMTKYAVMINDPSEILYHLEKACHLAMCGRRGPVWLDIPLDVQGAYVDTAALRHFEGEGEDAPPSVPDDVIEGIVRKIYNASAPVFLAGTGIHAAGAEDILGRVLEKYRIPVLTAWNANDLVPFSSPYFAGMPGTVGTRQGNFVLQNCDLLISLGCRMNIRMIGYTHFDFAKNAYKIAVDIDGSELEKPTLRIDLPVRADVGEFLRKLDRAAITLNPAHEKWCSWCRKLGERYPSVTGKHFEKSSPVNPYAFMDSLFDALPEDERIVCGNGSACVITFQAAKVKRGQRMYTNSGSASMGYAVPAALGAWAEDREKRVICIDGDGSIMMNLQELMTISSLRADIIIFLLNNNGYHSMRQTQKNLFRGNFVGAGPGSGVSFPDFEKTAQAFGLAYERIERTGTCSDRLPTILAGKGPMLCEVLIDESQDFEPKISSRVLPDGSIVSPTLDDMSPFLDREEYESIRYRQDR